MRNKIREKFIASVMLSAFVMTNSLSAFAMNEYYGYDSAKPAIRTGEAATSLEFKTEAVIPNADSVVNLSLRDADVTQVLRMFADQAGMNIIFSSDVSGTVTMDLVDIPLSEALDLVVATNKLFYDVKANTLIISTEDSALSVSNKSMTMVPVKYVSAGVLATFLNNNIFKKEAATPGMSNKSVVTVNPATNELIVMGTQSDVAMVKKIVEQFDKKPTITTYKVNHTTPAEMATMICSSLIPATMAGGSTGGAAGVPTGFASDSSGGGASMGIAVGGGQMACSTQGAESSGDIEALNFNSLAISYFPTLGTIQIIGGSESQLEMIREYIAETDKKAPQAYLEMQIISLNEAGSKQFDNTWQYLSKNFSFNAGGGSFGTMSQHPIFFSGNSYLVPDTAEGWNEDTQWYDPSGKIKKSTSSHLVYSMNYLISNSKGRVLANPKVLLTSGQTSTIDLSSDYISKVTTQYLDSAAGAGSAQVQKEYEIKDDNGIKVEITPFISPDGYVTLDIKPEYKTIASKEYSAGEADERELVATLLQRRDLDLKGIRIKDGETLVIGGMISENETKNVSKIPFLGDLPVIGMFFRSTDTTKTKEEMVIMLTPQIVVDTEDAVAEDNLL